MNPATAVSLRFPPDFNLTSTGYSHGWSSLAPFRITTAPFKLERVVRYRKNALARVELTVSGRGKPVCVAATPSAVSGPSLERIAERVGTMLQFGCDLRPFYDIVRADPALSWAVDAGAGRMLRGETFFEDTVKTILTTNCSWALTTSMNNNILSHFGFHNTEGLTGYPEPAVIADSSVAYLRRECRLGYRADYVYELAARCASGELDIEAFRDSDAPASELYEELRTIKGIGDYAAANLLRMLGKFEYLGLDSWCRNTITKLHGNGRRLSDKEIESIYEKYGSWKGLAMWLDVTRSWYTDKFPAL